MKIGFDISQTGRGKAGCGFFADSLIRTLTSLDDENEYILYPNFGTSFWDPGAARTIRMIDRPNVSGKRVTAGFDESMAFWKDLPLDADKRLGYPDIIHANNYSCPKGLRNARLVYTLYDLSFLEFPELTTEQNRCVCFEGIFDASIYSDFIISISHYTKKIFLETFPHFPPERIRVVHLGSRFHQKNSNGRKSRILKKLQPDQFWLSVCTLEPRKNLRRILKAFALFKRQTGRSYPLVLAGGKGWMEDDLEENVRLLGLTDSVFLPGYVSDDDLSWLYGNCFCFVYPSLYEGFGMPVLEAMGMGAAVITSNSTSLPEVAGDAARYVNPFDEADITGAFRELCEDDDCRKGLKKKALVRSGLFSWEKSTAEVLDIYNEVMEMPKRQF